MNAHNEQHDSASPVVKQNLTTQPAAAQEAVGWQWRWLDTDNTWSEWVDGGSRKEIDARIARWKADGEDHRMQVRPLFAAPVTAAPADNLHAHLLHMLGAKDHEDAGRIIGELHAAAMRTPATPGIDPTDPWRGLYDPARMPKLDGVGDYVAAHPDLPEWPEDDERSIAPLIRAQGFAWAAVSGDYGTDYMSVDEFDTCSWLAAWKPGPPAGEGWRQVLVHDTEDGPVAVFVRPLALIDASPKGALNEQFGSAEGLDSPKGGSDALDALRVAYRHLDVESLRVSHCNDLAIIRAAMQAGDAEVQP
ncbi:MAG: hypothetical protein FH747_00930 [Stenotrophomonas sp.]|uniref:hypothetical protein n=1 Tax=Stenotrophomonas sp. TaxID=69392 RepID=UPI001355E04A|nr:hypothetical protein [Stenotrophomonas sp.]MTI72210.1 hypothetical protein [Stenotrophomonas sp.]